MNKKWLLYSIIAGVLSAALSYYYFSNLLIACIAFGIIFLILARFSPHRRFMSAFWALLSTLVFLNKYSIQVIGDIMDVEFQFKSNTMSNSVSALLVILCIVTLLLDFFERRKKGDNLIATKKVSIKSRGDSYYSEGDMTVERKKEQ